MRHPVEERLQRLLAILAEVADQGPVPMAELSQRYKVSAHQLSKDLALAETMGIPPFDLPGEIPSVTFRGDTVEVWVPAHFATPPTLTRPEALAVLTAGRAALALNPELDALATAMDKLEEALELGGGVAVEFELPACLDRLRQATTERRRVQIVYWSAWRDELTDRRVEPLQVVFLRGEWYLLAWDVPVQAMRHFRIDRIERCDETDERFDPRPFGPLTEAFVAPAFAVLVTVRFPASARWVTEYVDMEIEDDGPDGFAAVVTSVGERWLERLLLRTGGEVADPDSLVGLGRTAAQRLLAAYEEERSSEAGGRSRNETST